MLVDLTMQNVPGHQITLIRALICLSVVGLGLLAPAWNFSLLCPL